MFAHTPGPWYVPKYVTWQIQREGASPGYSAVATTHNDVHDGRNAEESFANACLIAAAPDLLEAALAMLNAFGSEVWFGDKAQALDKLIDAINRAAGES